MVYSNHFVMCVLVNDKPLKERADGIVAIPLGAEYTIRFKNKNSRRAVVTFTIDGENASGNGYIINAHSDLEIKRFSDRDQMFKFVDLESGEAQLEGKNGPNLDGSKGVIEARFQLEREYVQPTYQPIPIPYPVPTPYPYPYPHKPWPRPYSPWRTHLSDSAGAGVVTRGGSSMKGMVGGEGTLSMSCSTGDSQAVSSNSMSMADCFVPGQAENAFGVAKSAAPSLAEGVTVGGNASGQRFHTVHFEAETDFIILRLVLRGTNEPVAVATAQATDNDYCGNCGAKKARKNDKFCGKCGNKF